MKDVGRTLVLILTVIVGLGIVASGQDYYRGGIGASPTLTGLLLGVGAAATPSITSTVATTSGLWFPAANKLALTTSGSATSGITIDSTGNVSIGTVTPADVLQLLKGSGYVTFGSPAVGYGGITFANAPVSLTNYAFMGNSAGTDVFLGRPIGGDINFREANGPNQLSIQHTTGNVIVTSSIMSPLYNAGASSVLTITANVIAPTNGIHHLGAGLVKTITVPLACAPTCWLDIVPDAAFTTDATGNIALASTAVLNRTLRFTWDGTKWNPSY